MVLFSQHFNNLIVFLFVGVLACPSMLMIKGMKSTDNIKDRKERQLYFLAPFYSTGDESVTVYRQPLLRNPYLLNSIQPIPEVPNKEQYFTLNTYSHDPYLSASTSATGRQFFGVANVFHNGYLPTQSSSCPACATCPNCAVCPAPCPGTTNASPLIAITIPTATSCTSTGNGANNFGPCTRTTAAPSGAFSVTFSVAVSATLSPTAFIGIVATCPNTKITLTCGSIPANIAVMTQNQIISSGTATLNPNPVTENSTSMQIIVAAMLGSAAQASVTCSWIAAP